MHYDRVLIKIFFIHIFSTLYIIIFIIYIIQTRDNGHLPKLSVVISSRLEYFHPNYSYKVFKKNSIYIMSRNSFEILKIICI